MVAIDKNLLKQSMLAASMISVRFKPVYKTIAHGCKKLAQGFYTAATWPGIEPHIIYDTLVRRSTSKPPSHRCPAHAERTFCPDVGR